MPPDAVVDTVRATEPAPLVSTAASSGIEMQDVTVSYRGTVALHALTLAITPGEIMAVIGPSGSGKTTALRAVAGFVRPTAGRIRIGGHDVTDLPPYARSIGMVVQNYALFPHMRVDENVGFGPRARGVAEPTVRQRVHDCLALVGMSAFTRRFPRELSGGQQQRVAIARALAIKPEVLLLDEPLSALDALIRRNMLDELARLHRELPSLTVMYVTHDQTEALTLADRIAIMRDGRLMALGPSKALYRDPPNRFAAEFLGRANLLPVRLEHSADGLSPRPLRRVRPDRARPSRAHRRPRLPAVRAPARYQPGRPRNRQRTHRRGAKRPVARRAAQHHPGRPRPHAAPDLHAAAHAPRTRQLVHHPLRRRGRDADRRR